MDMLQFLVISSGHTTNGNV